MKTTIRFVVAWALLIWLVLILTLIATIVNSVWILFGIPRIFFKWLDEDNFVNDFKKYTMLPLWDLRLPYEDWQKWAMPWRGK